VTEGARVEGARVRGDVAKVYFSWLVSRHPNPDVSNVGVEQADGRYFSAVTLRFERGRWRIGLAHE
jgi:hypothetical protein